MMNTYKKNNREKIISVASGLFLKDEVSNTSMDTIVKESGISKSNIYYHFKNKEDLILAAVDWYIDDFNKNVLEPLILKSHLQTEELLEAYVNTLEEKLIQSQFTEGCPFTSVIMKIAHNNEHARLMINRFFQEQARILATVISKGIRDGDIKKDINPEDTAYFILSTIEGSMVLAMSYRDEKIVTNTGNMLTKMIKEP